MFGRRRSSAGQPPDDITTTTNNNNSSSSSSSSTDPGDRRWFRRRSSAAVAVEGTPAAPVAASPGRSPRRARRSTLDDRLPPGEQLQLQSPAALVEAAAAAAAAVPGQSPRRAPLASSASAPLLQLPTPSGSPAATPQASPARRSLAEPTVSAGSPARSPGRLRGLSPRKWGSGLLFGRASRESSKIRELLRHAIIELPQAVTADSDMPALDELMEMAEQSEKKWTDIVMEMVTSIPLANPLSLGLLSIAIDVLPLPTRATISDACARLTAAASTTSDLRETRNLLAVWGALAEKMAGPRAEQFCTAETVAALCKLLALRQDPLVLLFAVLAVEKFAQTGANKTQLLAAGVAEKLRDLEDFYCCSASTDQAAETRRPAAEDRPKQSVATELHKAELGFCAMWTLDNVFPCEGRRYAHERTDLSQVNVMLDVKDATKHLKLAPDGLEARNDAPSFESVRATCSAFGGGVWYYEVTVFTNGIMQIGWATEQCAYQSDEGVGIGDDRYSFSYDGCRRLLWHRQLNVYHEHPPWKAGDVVGLVLDLDEGRVNFSLNGALLPKWRPLPGAKTDRYFPAISLMTYQHVLFNFGNVAFRYPPPFPVKTLNGVGHMSEEDKKIVPRLQALAMLQEELDKDYNPDAPRCLICYTNTPDAMLEPCNHKEFCMDCAVHCERCPLCRTDIAGRLQLDEAGNVVQGAGTSDDLGVEPLAESIPEFEGPA